jgi:hypothetical protein
MDNQLVLSRRDAHEGVKEDFRRNGVTQTSKRFVTQLRVRMNDDDTLSYDMRGANFFVYAEVNGGVGYQPTRLRTISICLMNYMKLIEKRVQQLFPPSVNIALRSENFYFRRKANCFSNKRASCRGANVEISLDRQSTDSDRGARA